jgi:hypothetical protein
MSYREELFSVIQSLTGQKNIITIPREFVAYTGDMNSAVLLSQVVYWSERTKDPNGWIFKTYKDWHNEIALSEYQVRQAAKKLKLMGILETKVKKAFGNPTVHYRLDKLRFSESFLEFLKKRKFENSRNDSEGNAGSSNTENNNYPTNKTETTTPGVASFVCTSDKKELQELMKRVPQKYSRSKGVLKIVGKALSQHGYDYTLRNIQYTNQHYKKNYTAYISKAMENDYGHDLNLEKDNVQQQHNKIDLSQLKNEKEFREKAKAIMSNLPPSARATLESEAIKRMQLSPEERKNIFLKNIVDIEMIDLIRTRMHSNNLKWNEASNQ